MQGGRADDQGAMCIQSGRGTGETINTIAFAKSERRPKRTMTTLFLSKQLVSKDRQSNACQFSPALVCYVQYKKREGRYSRCFASLRFACEITVPNSNKWDSFTNEDIENVIAWEALFI